MTTTTHTPIQTALGLIHEIIDGASADTESKIADARAVLATLPEFDQVLLQTDPDTGSLEVHCDDYGVTVSTLLDWQQRALYAFAAELHRLRAE